MHPIDKYLPDFGKRSRVDLLEEAILTLAKQVKALETRLFKLENRGQCE